MSNCGFSKENKYCIQKRKYGNIETGEPIAPLCALTESKQNLAGLFGFFLLSCSMVVHSFCLTETRLLYNGYCLQANLQQLHKWKAS